MRQRPEYDLNVIGRNLKRLREANHLTVREVRDYLRLGSVQAVYKYEKGISYPQTDAMFALMELYGAEIHDIVVDHEVRVDAMLIVLAEHLHLLCEMWRCKGAMENSFLRLQSYTKRLQKKG